MTLVSTLLSKRSLNNPQVPISSPSLVEWLNGGQTTDSGVPVSEVTALNMSAVWRATALVSGVASSLPLKTYRRSDRVETTHRRPLITDPSETMTALEFWRLNYVHRCLWGNAYAFKVRNAAGVIEHFDPIVPNRVQVARAPGVSGGKLFAVQLDDGHLEPYSSYEIAHFPGLGYDGVTGCSPVRAARAAIGLSLAAERYGGRLFGSGSLLGGVLQVEQRLDDIQADALKKRWHQKMAGVGKSHEIAVLDSGAKFAPITMPNSDAQFIESRRFQVSEIARFWGIPPSLLMDTDKQTSWGTGLEQQSRGFVVYDLHPQWLAPTEARIAKEFELGRGEYAEYTLNGLLRGDAAARAAYYRVMREVGAFSANDIRDKENEPPIPDGDTYLQPLNLVPLGSDPTSPQGANP